MADPFCKTCTLDKSNCNRHGYTIKGSQLRLCKEILIQRLVNFLDQLQLSEEFIRNALADKQLIGGKEKVIEQKTLLVSAMDCRNGMRVVIPRLLHLFPTKRYLALTAHRLIDIFVGIDQEIETLSELSAYDLLLIKYRYLSMQTAKIAEVTQLAIEIMVSAQKQVVVVVPPTYVEEIKRMHDFYIYPSSTPSQSSNRGAI